MWIPGEFALIALLGCCCSHVRAIPPECDPNYILLQDEVNCMELLRSNISSPSSGEQGRVFRNCTELGWTEPYPPHEIACEYGFNESLHLEAPRSQMYFLYVRIMYSVGYAVSLASLAIAVTILCFFRRLHCTRNFIHIQLFLSFILRAALIFIRDSVLFSSEDHFHCGVYPEGCWSNSWTGWEHVDGHQTNCSNGAFCVEQGVSFPGELKVTCKLATALTNYCIMANYSWLLAEGHYLYSLVSVSLFSQRRHLWWWYIILGWGSPMVIITGWSWARYLHEDEGCWETRTHEGIWWILRVPVLLFIIVNLIFFLCIIRILVAKLRTQDMSGNEFNHYRKLAKSSFLLMSLFGLHYILFAFLPHKVNDSSYEIWTFIELAFASTQGFVVAVLYCFLNGEVQSEVQRRWRRWRLKQNLQVESRRQRGSMSQSGGAPTNVSLLNKGPTSPKSSLVTQQSGL